MTIVKGQEENKLEDTSPLKTMPLPRINAENNIWYTITQTHENG